MIKNKAKHTPIAETITPQPEAPTFKTRLERSYLSQEFVADTWENIKPYAHELTHRNIESADELEQWLKDVSELETVIGEEIRWRMVRSSCNTADSDIKNAYLTYVKEVMPHLKRFGNESDKKLLASPYLPALEKKHPNYIREVRNTALLFREKNIPLQTEVSQLAQNYDAIMGSTTVEHQGKEYTLMQASKMLESTDRQLRKTIYEKIQNALLSKAPELNELFDKLLAKRHQIALNADFDNYRDYKFAAMGRFDYTPEDCYQLHDAIADIIVPLVHQLSQRRAQKMGLEKLRPYDNAVDMYGRQPLSPFTTSDELVQKSIATLSKVQPTFGQYLQHMQQKNFLDLDSRQGKAPGGFNCLMPESGVPFIFMNAVGSLRDVTTMVHEGGHAIHSFLVGQLPLVFYKSTPSEVAELASMSMELFTMEHWDQFFSNPDDLRRAQIEQLEKVISGLPWIAKVDAFQHWLYTHPEHTHQERTNEWLRLGKRFGNPDIDYSGYEQFKQHSWHRQLHIFRVPFYYIEYGMAQLGAIAMWQQYNNNPEQAIQNYTKALSLGYTQPIGKIYEAAGINFNFSGTYINDLAQFVMQKLTQLYQAEDKTYQNN